MTPWTPENIMEFEKVVFSRHLSMDIAWAVYHHNKYKNFTAWTLALAGGHKQKGLFWIASKNFDYKVKNLLK